MRIGIVVLGTVLSPLGMASASAKRTPKPVDPCTVFCKCRRKKDQDTCLAACRACGGDASHVGGSCGNYFCCSNGSYPCGNSCKDLANDPSNCGACGQVCQTLGSYEVAFCVDGHCQYQCVEGASYCDGVCTSLSSDPLNCGACGNVCSGPNPSCYQGTCSHCTPNCPERWCGGDGCGGECACPSGTYCESDGWCYDENPCAFPFILCGGACVDPTSDPFHCGGCFNQCGPSEACIGGFCESGG